MNPKVNYGLWMIMICQCGFISYNKRNTLVGRVDNGEAMHVVGVPRVYEKSVNLPLHFFFFFWKPETTLKKIKRANSKKC